MPDRICPATGKTQYLSIADARAAIDVVTKRHRKARDGTGARLMAFRCEACGAWHCGHAYHEARRVTRPRR